MYNSAGNQMIDPQLIFQKVQLNAGMHAADLGCGQTGHIVFPAAKIIGDHGVIYAVDILKEVLEIIKKRASLSNLLNIHTVWSNLELFGHTAIPAKSLDVAFLINTLVQSNNRHAIVKEAIRLMKDKARIAVVDWKKKGLTFGPEDRRFVNFIEVNGWAQELGFVLQEEFDAGPYHKGLVFYRNQ